MPLKKHPKQKRPSLLDDPPTASSSSESEEEHQTPSLLKKKPVDEEENASSESESDSGSDSDQAPSPLSPNPKSKPKPKSQIQASPSATPFKSAAKRLAEENGDTKRAKKNKGAVVVGSDEEKSKKPFQKVWSDEDEITIVKGLADFILRTGKTEVNGAEQNPTSDTKKSEPETIPELVSDMQMQVVTADSCLLLREMLRLSGLSEDLVKTCVELIGVSKREELEGKLKKIQVEELELFAERADLMEELSRLILEAVMASNNN